MGAKVSTLLGGVEIEVVPSRNGEQVLFGSMRVWLFALGFVIAVFDLRPSTPYAATTLDRTFETCSNCPQMVSINPGTFDMGMTPSESAHVQSSLNGFLARWIFGSSLQAESPQHKVTLSTSFAISRYPITQEDFARFIASSGYKPSNGCIVNSSAGYRPKPDADWLSPGFVQSDRDPVVCVASKDISAYADWLNLKSGFTDPPKTGFYRLPSEAEWEYAARAGSDKAHWWGEDIGVGNADCRGCGSQYDGLRTAPVDSFPANPFGVSGSLGNVWERVADCWHENYVDAPANGGVWKDQTCTRQVMRGGGLFTEHQFIRSDIRSKVEREERDSATGFRLVLEMPGSR